MKGIALRELNYFKTPLIIYTVVACLLSYFSNNGLSSIFLWMELTAFILIMSVFAGNVDQLQFYSSVSATKKQIVTARLISIVAFEVFAMMLPYLTMLIFGHLRYLTEIAIYGKFTAVPLPEKITTGTFLELTEKYLTSYAFFNFIFFSMIYRKNRNSGVLEFFLGTFGPFAVLLLIGIIIALYSGFYAVNHPEALNDGMDFLFSFDGTHSKIFLFGHDITKSLSDFKEAWEKTYVKAIIVAIKTCLYGGLTCASYFIARKQLKKITI